MIEEFDIFKDCIMQDDIETIKKFLKREDFDPSQQEQAALYIATYNDKLEILKIFKESNKFDFAFQYYDRNNYKSPFISAVGSSNIEVVNLFLKEKKLDPFLLKERVLIEASNNPDHRILKRLLKMSKDIKLNYDDIFLDHCIVPRYEHIKIYLKDERFNLTYKNYTAILILFLMYDSKNFYEEENIMRTVFENEELKFIPYTFDYMKDIAYKVKEEKYAMHKTLYSIPLLQKPLIEFLNKFSDTFPEYQEYINYLNMLNKVNKF